MSPIYYSSYLSEHINFLKIYLKKLLKRIFPQNFSPDNNLRPKQVGNNQKIKSTKQILLFV